MKLNIGLRGSLADDYARSAYQDIHNFLTFIRDREPISRQWYNGWVLFCYTREQNQELPEAVPVGFSDCN